MELILRIFIFTLFCLLPLRLFPQVKEYSWEFSDGERGDESFHKAIQLSNGYLALIKIKDKKEPVNPISTVIFLDFSTNNIESRIPLKDAPNVMLKEIFENPDGTLMLAGQFIGKESNKPWIGQLARSGNLLWQKVLLDAQDFSLLHFTVDSDNRFLIAGNKFDGSLHLAVYDSEGNSIWKMQWPAYDFGPLRRFSVSEKGKICLVGQTIKGPNQNRDDAWVMMLESDGKLLWKKSFGNKSSYEDVSDVEVLPDGSVLVCGESNSGEYGKLDMWLLKFSKSGIKQWEKYYGGKEEDRATALFVLHNGNILLAGQSLSLLNNKGATKYAGRLAELSEDGEKKWENDYGGEGNECFLGLCQIHDGSYLAVGWSDSKSNGGKDAWALMFAQTTNNLGYSKGKLQIEHSKPWLNTNDGVLLPGTNSYISVELTNQESGPIDNIRLEIKSRNTQNNIRIEPEIYIQPLFPGIPRKVYIAVQAGTTLETKDNFLEIDVYSGSNKVKTFNASFKTLNPKAATLSIEQSQVAHEGTDPLSPKTLTLEIQNDGDMPAEGVQVTFTTPRGILPLNGPSIAIDKIEPKTLQKIVFRFQKTVQLEENEIMIQCEMRDNSGQVFRKDLPVRLDVILASQTSDFIVFTYPNEAKNKKIDWNSQTITLEATFGTAANTLKPEDAVTKINGIVINQAKMDEEKLSSPSPDGNFKFFTYYYENTIILNEGENQVMIEVKTPNGIVQSRDIIINYRPKQPNLHVLSIGIPHRDLKYTTLDAENFAAAFSNQAGPEKVFGNVYVEKRNTKENTRNLDIRAGMEDLRRRYASEVIPAKIYREDVLIVFISSHGKTDDNNSFKILASDYDQYGDVSNIDYKRDILDALNTIDCKKFVFIDACHSGSAEGARLLSQARFALEEINAAYPGMNVLTSSQVDELSYEDDSWQNGAFTEAILEAFQIQNSADATQAFTADADGDRIIRFGELYNFLKKRVPNMVMEKKKRKQMPAKMSKGLGEDIPIFVLY